MSEETNILPPLQSGADQGNTPPETDPEKDLFYDLLAEMRLS